MTQSEKEVLTAIVAELEKAIQAVIVLQEKGNIHSMIQLPRKLDSLRKKIDALPST